MTATEPVSASDGVLKPANPITTAARTPIKLTFLMTLSRNRLRYDLLCKDYRSENAKTPCEISCPYDAAFSFGAAARGLPILASASVVTSFKPSAAS
ncbi:hypothetical protein BraRD5C2_61930 [Bradyrhizobium sp. RD5-C2]|nr:hypothetical protein BraRD5C2_61930 [Bradyrhizobium sp. RD5-C2]